MTNFKDHSVGVDWGSTSFRAYLYNGQNQLVDTISTVNGIKSVHPSQFESTLFEHIGHWVSPGSTVLLSGMITSRHGWLETTYIPIPAKLDGLLTHARKQLVRGTELIFLPGLSQITPSADVIRGEELQLFGATRNIPNANVVMPGTHSKWARIQDGTVTSFQTIVTGELFDTLLNNTLIGQLANSQEFDEAAFTQAVKTGYESTTLVAQLFQCRSGVLLGELQAEAVHSYLSGLLIGNEIREAQAVIGADTGSAITLETTTSDTNNSDTISADTIGADTTKSESSLVLVGADTLCERYQQAFNTLKLDCTRSDSSATENAFAALLSVNRDAAM